MRHFNYFENGGPFPGTCISCGGTFQLFDLNRELISGGAAMLCKRCTVELAEFVGFTDRLTADITISRLADEVTRLESQIQAIPNETENLIDSIRSSVSNFVLSISSKPDNNGNKTVPDSGGSPKSTSGSTKASGGNNKTRPESTSN